MGLQGGDLRSHRVEALAPVILAAVEAEVDITLVELVYLLEREHSARFAPSTVWRFLDRHQVTLKKVAHAAEQERPDVWPAGGRPGSMRSLISIPST